jgi:hypothetical protein
VFVHNSRSSETHDDKQMEQKSTTYLNAAVQTSPCLCNVDGHSEKSRISQKKGFDNDLLSGILPSSISMISLRNRRHTFSNSSDANRTIDTQLRSSGDLAPGHVSQETLAPSLEFASCDSIQQTPKRVSDPQSRVIRGPSSRNLSPVSSTSSPASSDSDSVEIIDHRPTFDSPDYFRHFIETSLTPATAKLDFKFDVEDGVKVDDEGGEICHCLKSFLITL